MGSARLVGYVTTSVESSISSQTRAATTTKKSWKQKASQRQDVRRFPGLPHSVCDISWRERRMQIRFLSSCKTTCIVQQSAGVWMKGWNTISLATRLIQIRSFMKVFFVLFHHAAGQRTILVSQLSHRTRPWTSLVSEHSFQVLFTGVNMHVHIIGVPTQNEQLESALGPIFQSMHFGCATASVCRNSEVVWSVENTSACKRTRRDRPQDPCPPSCRKNVKFFQKSSRRLTQVRGVSSAASYEGLVETMSSVGIPTQINQYSSQGASSRWTDGGISCGVWSVENVKSTSPITENHYKNGYVNYTNFIKTNEDINNDTKHTINNDTNNHNARDLHEWAQQRAVSCVSCLDVESWSCWFKSFTCLSSHLHAMYMCVSLWLLRHPFLLRPVLPRLLPLLCPDAPWPAHRPRQPGLRGI